MSIVLGPHHYSIYYDKLLNNIIYLFGEFHAKTVTQDIVENKNIPFVDFILNNIKSNDDKEIDIYLEKGIEKESSLLNENYTLSEQSNQGIYSINYIYKQLMFLHSSHVHVHRADLRTTGGNNNFNDIISALYMSLAAYDKPFYISLLEQLYGSMISIRKEGDYDDSIDFLVFQSDDTNVIHISIDTLSDDIWYTIKHRLNQRLHDIGLTKKYFLAQLLLVITKIEGGDKDALNECQSLAVSLIKWQSVILDLYIITHIMNSTDGNVIVYCGQFHIETIEMAFDALHLHNMKKQTNSYSNIVIDKINFGY